MDVLKKTAGLLVFAAALAGAVAVSRYFAARRAEPAPAPPLAAEDASAPPPAEAAAFRFKARFVTLNFADGKAHVTVELERDRARPAPERLWVAASFFSPEGGAESRCAGGPVEVRRPFTGDGREVIIVETVTDGCVRPRTPAATYYARVHVAADAATAARAAAESDADLARATPVVVQGLRR
jgi:hypothetical protein